MRRSSKRENWERPLASVMTGQLGAMGFDRNFGLRRRWDASKLGKMNKASIGFVGVGRMGSNMARRLADLGYPIATVFDPHESLATSLAIELGAKAVTSLSEVTAASDVIFTVVTDDAAMRGIFAGEESLLKGAAGKTFINCATV